MPADAPITRVCLRCRRGLTADERCPSGQPPEVASLTTAPGRATLREHAWAVVPKIKWLGTNWRLVFAIAGASLGGLAAIVATLLWGEAIAAVFVGMGGAFMGLLVFGAIALGLPAPASFYRRLPVGVERGCGADVDERARGVLAKGEGARAGDGPLVTGVELRVRGAQVTLRTGASDALLIELEDGRRVHVRSGPVELSGEYGAFDPLDEDAARAVSESLGGTPDAAFLEEEEGPIPAEAGRRYALGAGARVEIRGPLKVAPREAHGGAFRTAANRDLEPVGRVRLHVLSH